MKDNELQLFEAAIEKPYISACGINKNTDISTHSVHP